MKSASPVVEVTALRVEREAVILDSIDWQVERGQHWAILGPNGSGKTSLLRALTGYLPPTAGEYSRAGRNLRAHRLARTRKRIGSSVRASPDDGRQRDGVKRGAQRPLRANRVVGRDCAGRAARRRRDPAPGRGACCAIVRGSFSRRASASAS